MTRAKGMRIYYDKDGICTTCGFPATGWVKDGVCECLDDDCAYEAREAFLKRLDGDIE